MRIKNRVCIVAVLLMAGLAFAEDLTWVGDANSIANWGIASNWTPAAVPTAADKVKFNTAGASECQVTDAQVVGTNMVQADGGPGGVLRIMPGGTLTQSTDVWSSVGYNNTAKLIVEEGGECYFKGHMWWGMHTGADSIVEIKGGFVTNDQSFGLGEFFGGVGDHGQCKVYITNNGELNIHHWSGAIDSANPVFWNGSLIDIGFGKMVIRNNSAAQATAYINAGRIKGFGGLTTPTAVFANNVTTITAPDPMNRYPVYITVLAGNTNLTWVNLAPVAPATDVWVDVYFGPDPNMLSPANTKVVSKGKNLTSKMVSAPSVTEPTTYYWKVDSYLKGDPAIVVYDVNNPVTEGVVTPFDVTNNTPPAIVINTPPTATWINEPIQLDSTLTDDGTTPVTYLWTSDDPNAVFTPSATVADPAVSVNWHTAQFIVTVTVDDGFNLPASASVTHDCALDACQATTAVIHLNNNHKGDVALDCQLNLTDFAVFARNWLDDYQLTAPVLQ